MATKRRNTNDWPGTARNDPLYGLAGNDILWGLGGDDVLNGENGNDVLIGGAGADSLWGEEGNDILVDRDGDGGRDYLLGGPGDDVLVGDRGGWFSGSEDEDLILGIGGNTMASYSSSEDGVTGNLETGEARRGDAEGDILIGITKVGGANLETTR